MEIRHELHARDALVFVAWPRSCARLLCLPINQPQVLRVVLESDDAMLLVGKQVVDDLAFEVGLLGEPHRTVVVFLDIKESDAVVGAEDEVVVRAVTVIWLFDHASDHAEIVEEAVRNGFRLFCHLEKVEFARVLGKQHVCVRFLSIITHCLLRFEDYDLGNPLISNFRLVAGLETMINVPLEEMTLHAPSEKKVTRARHTSRFLSIRIQIRNQAQIMR